MAVRLLHPMHRDWVKWTMSRGNRPQFEMSGGLNDSPPFIAALVDLVATAIGVSQRSQSDTERLVAAD